MQTQSFQQFQKLLGSRIQEIRKAKGFSQEEIGFRIDMDRVSIGYIEQGRRAPKLSTLYALAQVFEIDVKSFFESE